MRIFLGYLILIVLELLILPTEKWLHDNLDNKEIARKWGHFLSGVILWTGSYIFLRDTIHVPMAAFLYMVAAVISDQMELIADKREDSSMNNRKATFLLGWGYFTLSVMAYTMPLGWLYYGLGIATICVGDAAAALVGVKFKNCKWNLKFPNKKSIFGAVSFAYASLIAMCIVCLVMGFNPLLILPQLFILSKVGAITELVSGDYDNLLVPVLVASLAVVII